MTDEEMFKNNMGLAYKISRQYLINHGKEFEDIKQIALLGLWKAIKNYNHKNTFSSFAYLVIKNEINFYLRKNKKHYKNISVNKEIAENLTIEDCLKEDFDYIKKLEEEIEINEIRQFKIKELKKMREIDQSIYKYFEMGKTQKQISELLNITQPTVSRIKKKIIKKLRENYNQQKGANYYD